MNPFAHDLSLKQIQEYHATKPKGEELLRPSFFYSFTSYHAKIFVRYIDYWNYIHHEWWSAAHPLPSCNYVVLNDYQNIEEIIIIAQTDFRVIDLYFDNTDEGKYYAVQFPLYLEDIEYQYKAHIGADPITKTKAIEIWDKRKQYQGFTTLSDFLVDRYQQAKKTMT